MSQIDIAGLANAVNSRPDAIRIQLGIPTRLQKEIRGADTYLKVAGLRHRFEERNSSCGPKFEPEEKAEYEEKKEILFEREFLVEFISLDTPLPEWNFFSDEERELMNKRVILFIRRAIDEVSGSLRKTISLSLELLSEKHPNAHILHGDGVARILKEAILAEAEKSVCRRKSMKTVAQVFAILSALEEKEYLLRFHFYGRGFERLWSEVWQRARTLEEVVNATGLPKDALSSKARTERFKMLLAESFSNKLFAERLAYAESLTNLDAYHKYSPLTTEAFCFTLSSITTKDEARVWHKSWEKRIKQNEARRNSAPYSAEKLEAPGEFFSVWDALHKKELDTDVLEELRTLYFSSPAGSQTHFVAEVKITEAMRAEFASVSTKKQLAEFRSKLGWLGIAHSFWSELRELEGKFEAEDDYKEALSSEEVPFLASVYRSLVHRGMPDEAREVLLRLAKHFPAEELDILPDSVESASSHM